jgi:hypothetical protein
MDMHALMNDPITAAVKQMIEAGYSKEVITGALKISDEDLKLQLNLLYARTFDITTKHWSTNPDYNRTFLQTQEQWMNDRLRARGHVFLNEVYDALGMTLSAQGAIVGWFWVVGSNSIRFDVIDMTRDGGYVLQFNPDGVIYNKLPMF